MSTKQYAYFSAAIRDGIEKYPKEIHGPFFRLDSAGEICGTCAIGAGLVMCGITEGTDGLRLAFPYMTTRVEYPPHPGVYGEIVEVAIALFESDRWTREQVCDWLYAEEEKLGFVTLLETEALKPEMIAEPETVKVTV